MPASASLTVSELGQLGTYDEDTLAPFDPDAATDPFELSEMTRSAARQAAQGEMEKRHREHIRSREDLLLVRSSSVVDDLSGRPVLVPVFIGAYRYGDGVYRVLVNGQSGRLIGKAPISWRKVLAAVLAVLAAIAALVMALSVCSGLVAWLA